ncbi:GldG family protein [Qipengyuania qiaonensis]|uniref:GldG family protein n=1 Tax=Qipengyuania qiaonensis TaxID=2867240 RepID=A0ABS7JAF7_9SPHN|nr:GldG family protein [Qipengyuania qiaonensis]MBX7483286.1 GldG family protein [Qipengyuania qiaonensis]
MPPWLRTSISLTLLLALLAACSPGQATEESSEKPTVGLFASLPIFWGEGGPSAILAGTERKDWVRSLIEKRFAIAPLDTLEAEAVDGVARIIMAQPRPLAPSENVALDNWVRQGGRLLIFADPLLTRHSELALGDKQRPQDVVLISPILSRWGLELRFDEDQPGGTRYISAFDRDYPVNLAGHFVLVENDGCTLSETGLLAQCDVGKGRVTLMADAAILDDDGSSPGRASLESLIAIAFDR